VNECKSLRVGRGGGVQRVGVPGHGALLQEGGVRARVRRRRRLPRRRGQGHSRSCTCHLSLATRYTLTTRSESVPVLTRRVLFAGMATRSL
jgi:hypothetical protein